MRAAPRPERLKLVLPIFLIAFLLYANTGSAAKAGIVLLIVPFSVVGAVWLMWLLGYNVSIAAWVGMIAHMGLVRRRESSCSCSSISPTRRPRERACFGTARIWKRRSCTARSTRVRPKMMTVMAAFMGLMPIMWSTGTGANVMRRIAAPMVGGLTGGSGPCPAMFRPVRDAAKPHSPRSGCLRLARRSRSSVGDFRQAEGGRRASSRRGR